MVISFVVTLLLHLIDDIGNPFDLSDLNAAENVSIELLEKQSIVLRLPLNNFIGFMQFGWPLHGIFHVLREGNFNAVIAEGLPNCLVHFAADAHVVHRVGDPEAQGVVDGGIAVAQH